MSAGGAFGGARGYQPKPPDKGVFPLDHFGECKQVKEEYMQCLKQYSNEAENCRGLAKRYLECRMSRNLMAQQDLKDLGFRDGSGKGAAPDQGSAAGSKSSDSPERDGRRTQGFIAGLPRR